MRHRNLANYNYLFFYLKYEAQYIFITDTYLFNKNIECKNLVSCKYLFFYLKYKIYYIFIINTY